MVPCISYLRRKIKKNVAEWKVGRFNSLPQAIAVSYSQVIKRYPLCKFKKPK